MARRKRAKNWDEYAKQMENWWQGAQYSKTYNPNAEQAVAEKVRKLNENLPSPKTDEGLQQGAKQALEDRSTLRSFAEQAIQEHTADVLGETEEDKDEWKSRLEEDSELNAEDIAKAQEAVDNQKPQEDGFTKFLENTGIAFAWANHYVSMPLKFAGQVTNVANDETFVNAGEAWDSVQWGSIDEAQAEKIDEDPNAEGFFARNKKLQEAEITPSFGQIATANPLSIQSKFMEQVQTVNEMIHGDEAENVEPKNRDVLSDEFQDWSRNTGWGKTVTGVTDLAQELILDPTNLVAAPAKAGITAARGSAKVGRDVERIRNAFEASNKAKVETSISRFRDHFWDNGAIQLGGAENIDVASSTKYLERMGLGDRADIADMLLKAQSKDELETMILAGAGDLNSARKLEDEALSTVVSRLANDKPDSFMEYLSRKANPDADETIVDRLKDGYRVALEDPKMMDKLLTDYAKRDPEFQKAMEASSWMGGMQRGTVLNQVGPKKAGVDAATGETLWADEKSQGLVRGTLQKWGVAAEGKRGKTAEYLAHRELGMSNAQVKKFQIGKVRWNVMGWARNERPSGWMNLKGASAEGSAKEFTAIVNSVKLPKSAENDRLIQGWYNKWGAAAGDEAAMAKMFREIESEVMQRQIDEVANAKWDSKAIGGKLEEKDLEAKEAFMRQAYEARETLIAKRDSTHKGFVDNGYRFTETKGDEIQGISTPQFESHLASSIPVMDFAAFGRKLSNEVDAFAIDWVKRGGRGVYNLNEGIVNTWKPTALLRLAYPMRNGVDNTARAIATVGLYQLLKYQEANPKWNTAKNAVRRLTGRQGGAQAKAGEQLATAQADLTAMNKRYQKAMHGQNEMEKMRVNIELGEYQLGLFDNELRSTVDAFDDELYETLKRQVEETKLELAVAEGKVSKAQLRVDSLRPQQRSDSGTRSWEFRDADGNVNMVETPGAFHGKMGEAARLNSSSGNKWRDLSGTNQNAAMQIYKHRAGTTNTVISPDSSSYGREFVKMANNMIRGTKIGELRLADADFDDVFDVIGKDKRARRFLEETFDDLDVDDYWGMKSWWDQGQETFGKIFADRNVRSLLLERDITEGDIAAMLKKKDQLAPIVGDEVFGFIDGSKTAMEKVGSLKDAAFHAIGTIPEDAFGRSPLYITHYEQFMENAIRKAGVADPTLNEIHKMSVEAHRHALRRVKNDLYTVERRTGLVNALEQFSPFFGAQWNSAVTWGRIMAQNPRIPSRMAQGAAVMNETDMIEDGGIGLPQVKWGPIDTTSMEARIPIDNLLSIFTGGTQMNLENLGESLGVDGLYALGLILPQAGPQFQIAVSELEKKQFLDDDTTVGKMITDWVNPLGPSLETASYDMLLPTWVNKVRVAMQGDGAAVFHTYKTYLWQQEETLYRMGARTTRPTDSEIDGKTRELFLTQAIGAFGLPGTPQFKPHIQPLLDAQTRLNKALGGDQIKVAEAFIAMYGEEARALTQRGTKNRMGLPNTQAAWNVIRDNPDLIEQLVALSGDQDPKIVGQLLGDVEFEYSASARRKMQLLGVSGKPGQQVQDKRGIPELQKALDIADGWSMYNKLFQSYATQAEAKFVKTNGGDPEKISDSKWIPFRTEMAKLRRSVKDQIGSENENWKIADRAQKGNETSAIAESQLRLIVADKKFAKKSAGDPYWDTVRAYLKLRDQASGRERRKGHNNRLTSKVGKAEKARFDKRVTKLRQGNARFNTMYGRFLDSELYWEQLGR